MGYFLSHIGIILIAGLVIAFVAFAAVLMAAKNARTRTPEETKERLQACEGCAMAGLCMTMGQKTECESGAEKTN